MKTWPTKKLGEVCERIKIEKAPAEITPYVEIGDIDIDKKTINLKEKGAVKGSIFAPANCVIVSRVRPTRGAVSLLNKKMAISSAFTILKPKTILNLQFLFYALAYSPKFFDYLGLREKGSSYPSCREKDILNFEVPLPSLKIQKRIVARIEELFEKIDKAKELRQKAQEETTGIFPSGLRKVFTALRVKQETLSQLCETIYRYPSFYGIKWKKWKRGRIPVLRGENIKNTNLLDDDLNHYNCIEKLVSDKFPKTILKQGDLVMCVRGTIGKIAIVDKNFEGTNISPNLIRIAPVSQKINSQYLLYFLSSFTTKEYLTKFTAAATVPTIKATDLKKLKIPLPPLPEQKKIVVYLDGLREKVEKLKQIQQKQLEELTELKQSILDKFFNGKF